MCRSDGIALPRFLAKKALRQAVLDLFVDGHFPRECNPEEIVAGLLDDSAPFPKLNSYELEGCEIFTNIHGTAKSFADRNVGEKRLLALACCMSLREYVFDRGEGGHYDSIEFRLPMLLRASFGLGVRTMELGQRFVAWMAKEDRDSCIRRLYQLADFMYHVRLSLDVGASLLRGSEGTSEESDEGVVDQDDIETHQLWQRTWLEACGSYPDLVDTQERIASLCGFPGGGEEEGEEEGSG